MIQIGEKQIYQNAVIHTYEVNNCHDSDFYAVVWDEETQMVKNVEYDTTRFASVGYAKVDITHENRTKAKTYLAKIYMEKENEKIAQESVIPKESKEVEIVNVKRGKLIPYLGKKGKVTRAHTTLSYQYRNWKGAHPSSHYETIYRIEGVDAWIPEKKLKVVHPEQYAKPISLEKALDESPSHLISNWICDNRGKGDM